MGNKHTRQRVEDALQNLESLDPESRKNCLICPITGKIFRQPTKLLSSQVTYERVAIERWLEDHAVDPATARPVLTPGYQINGEMHENVANFLRDYPEQHANQFPENVDEVNQILEERIPLVFQQVVRMTEDFNEAVESLKRSSIKLFRRKGEAEGQVDEKSDEVEYSEDHFLETDIPIISFMGPSRIGKSTLLNDLMNAGDGEDIFGISHSKNVACTDGAWIAFYQSEEFECFLVDVEGLSHGVTEFTKSLFYACYAISNVVVWNMHTQAIGTDEFKVLMGLLQKNMSTVSRTERKPSFLLLERDFDEDEFDPQDDLAGHPNLEEYIRNHESWNDFNRMRLFSQTFAYSIPKRRKKARLDPEVYRELMNKIRAIAQNSTRFAGTQAAIMDTLRRINDRGELSAAPRMLQEHEVLGDFLLPPNDGKHHSERFREMTKIAIKYNWDPSKIEGAFLKYNDSVLGPMIVDGILKGELRKEFVANFREIVERVENKVDNLEWITNWTTTAESVGGTILGSAVGIEVAGGTTAVASAVAAGTTTVAATATVGVFMIGLGAVGLGVGYLTGRGAGWMIQKAGEGAHTLGGKIMGTEYIRYTLGKTNAEKQLASNPNADTETTRG